MPTLADAVRDAADRDELPARGNAGHGHVRPRVDGVKARCGGPALCAECAREQARVDAASRGEKP